MIKSLPCGRENGAHSRETARTGAAEAGNPSPAHAYPLYTRDHQQLSKAQRQTAATGCLATTQESRSLGTLLARSLWSG